MIMDIIFCQPKLWIIVKKLQINYIGIELHCKISYLRFELFLWLSETIDSK